ncbi:McbB family protein [Anoxybacillus sp. FSL W8-0703]|uniref:McbB family protein n=1 Tax=Anoxybacillus sp. FSL W8-0703 TaxID=2954704 RepID=UPI0030F8C5F4
MVQNAKGIVRAYDSRLKDFFKEWDEFGTALLSYSDFEKFFGKDTKEALEFLKEYHIIEDKIEPNLNIKRISVYTNNVEVGGYIEKILRIDYKQDIDVSMFYNRELSPKQLEIQEGDLILVFLNPYNRRVAKGIRDKVKSVEKAFLLFTYVYGNCFYMDSLYNGFLKPPCHLCHISYIESSIRTTDYNGITYQHIIDSLYSDRSFFSIEVPLTQSNIFNIVTQITNRISKLILLDEGSFIQSHAFLESYMFDLATRKLYVDNPIHWELCDCYE